MRKNRIFSVVQVGLFALTVGVGSAGGALADGGGGGGSPAPLKCKAGWVPNNAGTACVRAQSGLTDDEVLYTHGRQLALDGHYQDALALLDAMVKKDSMALTMIGYSMRKMGNVDEGIAVYQKALALDPNNIHTREYLGEGYVSMGRVDLAQVQLDRIEAICGTGCEQYAALSKAMETGTNW